MLYQGMSGELMTADLFEDDENSASVSDGASVEGAAVSASAGADMMTVTAVSAGGPRSP